MFSLSFAFANLTSISRSPVLLFIFLSIIFIFLSAVIISAITCRCIWWISWISLIFRSLFSSFWLVKSVRSSLIRWSLSKTFDLFEIFTSSPPISLSGFQIVVIYRPIAKREVLLENQPLEMPFQEYSWMCSSSIGANYGYLNAFTRGNYHIIWPMV